MPGTLPSQILRFAASTAVIVLLAAHCAALAQQKPAAPSPSSLGKLEDRVNQLETDLRAAQQKAEKATMDKDYILHTQNHYESYYREVFSTQTHILWTIGVTATLLSITLTAVFFVAGRFGFNIFDRKIDSSLRDAAAQLRTEFTQLLAKEMQSLQEANAAQLKALEEGLTKRISEQEEDLKNRSRFQFDFAQGLAAAADERYDDAGRSFRRALEIYKLCRPKQLFKKHTGALAVRNIFVMVKKVGKANFAENAKKELEDELYNDIEDELARAAISLNWLVPILKERKPDPSKPVAAEPKPAAEKKPIEPLPAAPPNDDK
jgi:hypothetical protein